MAYPCDLPANMGNNDIFRAIYAKLSDINPSTGTIEQKLDIIQDQLTVVNNNIEANTQAIKDISINVDIHSKDIQNITKAINKQTNVIENIQIHIDTSDLTDSVQLVAAKVEDGFVKTVEAIKYIKREIDMKQLNQFNQVQHHLFRQDQFHLASHIRVLNLNQYFIRLLLVYLDLLFIINLKRKNVNVNAITTNLISLKYVY